MKNERKENLKLMQLVILLAPFCLALIGLAIFYSMKLTSTNDVEQARATLIEYGVYLIIAVLVTLLVAKFVSKKTLRKLIPFFYILAIVATLLLKTPLAISRYGVTKHLIFWLKPAYLLVLSHVLLLSYLVTSKAELIKTTPYTTRIWGLTLVTMVFVALAGCSNLNIIVVGVSFFVSYMYGNRRLHKMILIISGILLVLFYVGCFLFLKDGVSLETLTDYRVQRLIAWVNPELYQDSLGLEAIHIKEIWEQMSFGGVGYNNGKFITIFPAEIEYTIVVIAEEFGWLGIAIVVVLYLVLCYQLLQAARLFYRRRDMFATLISSGTLIHIVISSLLNFLEMSNIVPYIGLTMPFLSAQRGDIVVLFIELACVLVCLKATEKRDQEQEKNEEEK